jgi:RNA polymerase sigma-70 factor, ECF subfamily
MDERDEVGELLARIGLRDAQAFETLYRRVAGRLMAVALRVMQDRAAAEDVLQEVFAALWNRADHAAPGQHRTLAWLCVVTRNRAIDLLRKRKPEEPLHWSGEDGEERVYRRALLLAFHDGLTHVEIAQRMARPLGTVKAWTRRSLVRLKGCMEALA